MWPSLLISLIAFERQAELSAPSPVIRVSGCELNLHLQILVPWPRATWCPCLPFTTSTMMQKNHLKHNCTITSLSTNPFPPRRPPSRSNWKSNLSWCCVEVERRTSSTACSLFRSLSTAHICIDLQLFLSRRDGWQLYQEADPYWSERGDFTRPSFDGGRRSWLK